MALKPKLSVENLQAINAIEACHRELTIDHVEKLVSLGVASLIGTPRAPWHCAVLMLTARESDKGLFKSRMATKLKCRKPNSLGQNMSF